MSPLNDERFSETRAKAILKRAVELDAERSLTTREDLYDVASELGIDRATVDRAADIELARIHASRDRGARRATMLAAAGIPLGVISGTLLATLPLFSAAPLLGFVAGAGFIASGGLLILQGSRVTPRSFIARNAALWGGIAAGSLAAIAILGVTSAVELPWLYLTARAVRGWLASTIVGSAAAIAIRNVVSRRNAYYDSSAQPAERGDGLWRRVTSRIRRWFDAGRHTFRQSQEDQSAQYLSAAASFVAQRSA